MMNAFVCALSWMCFGVGFGGLSVMGVPSVTSGRQQSHRASKGITQLLSFSLHSPAIVKAFRTLG